MKLYNARNQVELSSQLGKLCTRAGVIRLVGLLDVPGVSDKSR